MDIPVLSTARTAELSKLRMKKYRQETSQMIIDGSRVIHQMLSDGIKPIQLYIGEGHDLPEGFPDVQMFRVSENGMRRICDTENPQSIAGLYPLPKARKTRFTKGFYLDGISDPGNMGTIFRIARSFGFDSILLSPDCVEVSSPKVVRASLGAVYSVHFCESVPKELAGSDRIVIGTNAVSANSLHSMRWDFSKQVLVVIGSEAHGMSPEVESYVDLCVKIDMLPEMESLNAAVAAGIIAHHIYHLEHSTDSV